MSVIYSYGPIMQSPPEPEPPPRLGALVRRVGETLSWEVIDVGENRVLVRGPADRRGYMQIDRAEFDEKWERA